MLMPLHKFLSTDILLYFSVSDQLALAASKSIKPNYKHASR